MDQATQDIFLSHGTRRRLHKGQYLLERGSPANEIWYILQGTVRAFSTSHEGEEITLFYIREGNIIYYESLVPGSRVLQDAQALTAVEVCTLSAEKFLQIWQPSTATVQALASQFLDRITLLHEYILCSHFHDSTKRVAYFLVSNYRRSGPIVSYTNEQIAAITGVNRISVNRTLNDFVKLGYVSLGYGQIRLLDPDGLSEIFDSMGIPSPRELSAP